MIKIIQNKISEYVSKYANLSCWESVREKYGAYSYLAFLCLVVNLINSVKTWKDVFITAIENKIESEDFLATISQITVADQFVPDFLNSINWNKDYDICNLYQEYLSIDFIVKNNKISFDYGKNNRDILGAYYTQYDFAQIITQKAFNDFFIFNEDADNLKIVDYSCGGAIFLLAAIKICQEKGITANIYGFDVDPIAVIISRIMIFQQLCRNSNIKVTILLGNPLLPQKSNCKDKFMKALLGRFYNQDMGITPINDADLILGNPPWEKIRFEEKKFLHHFFPENSVSTKTERDSLIKLASHENSDYYFALSNDYSYSKKYIKAYPLFDESCVGELNTYALFTELSQKMLKKQGVASLIVKSSLVRMPVYSNYFKKLTSIGDIYGLYMFSNKNKIFNIDSREEFSVLYLSKANPNKLHVALNIEEYKAFTSCPTITLSVQDFAMINPDTNMIPNIKSNDDLQFLLNLYRNNSTFGTVYNNCHFGRVVHLTTHSASIRRNAANGYSAIYEGKFIEQYTAKYASFGQMDEKLKYKNKASARLINNPQGNEYPESRFFIDDHTWNNLSKNFQKGFVIAWRSLTSATNRRTMLATLLPLIPTCQSIQILQLSDERQMLHILALFNSIVFDYIVRLKMVGLDLTQTIIKQIPVPQLKQYDEIIMFKGRKASISSHIISRLRVLYADDIRFSGIFEKYHLYNVNDDRKTIISDLDKIVGYLYGIKGQALRNIAYCFNSFYSKEDVTSRF